MPDIPEPDWKRFKEIRKSAIERFAQKFVQQVQYHRTDQVQPAVERFCDIRDAVDAWEKRRTRLFDDLRRSTAIMQIAMMRAEKLITDEEMLRFSDYVREAVAVWLSIRE